MMIFKKIQDRFTKSSAISLFFALLGLTVAAPAAAVYTVTPETWNTIGLDSNTPASGPNHFPVGARVCGGMPSATDTATLTWDAGGTDSGTYIYLRSGSANPVNFTFNASGCADAYFEVEVNQTALAYDQTRRYHITAGSVSTPTPRELYVEHLVSQARNGVTDMKVGPVGGPLVSVSAGGSMNLVVGNSYDIELDAFTATQGYSQLESFINFSNVVFQIVAVNTTYSVVSVGNSGGVTSPNSYLYSNACLWDNDPTSPYYRSCLGSGNAGGTITTKYTIKILGGGGTSVALNTLAHDFSGSSFHYNSDYSTSARIGNIIDPTATTISKSFFPSTTNAGGVSTLTFTLTNPNAGAVSGLNFIDVFPTSPGAMTLSSTTTTNTCGGTLTNNSGGALAMGSVGIKLAGATVPANSSCIVQVDVTIPATGTYANTSNHLFVDLLDTGKFATASLTVNSTPAPPAVSASCSAPVQLAAWNFDALTAGANTAPAYSSKASDVSTATATFTGSGTGDSSAITAAQSSTAPNSWSSSGYTALNTATSATAAYIDFALDTSNYGGVGISYSAFTNSGNWGGTNHLYSYSKANAGAFTLLVDTNGMPTAFTTYTAAAAATGNSTTTFRLNASGSKSNPSYSTLFLDNIIFTGCTRPDPIKLTLTKSFATNPVAVKGTSTLTFTITNSNATSTASLTGISFSDVLPLQALQGTVAVTNLSPTVTGTGTAFKTQLAAGSIVSIGGVSYTVSTITSNTVLTLTANYAGATASGLSMSSGLTVATSTASACGGTNNVTTTASTGTIAMTGGTLAPGASCTVTATVTANAAGARENVSGFISSTVTGTNTSSTGVATATLTAVLPPSISKLFAPNPILANGISTLTFTITNPNQNNALSGVAFSDTFPVAPGAMTVAAPLTTTNTCGGAALQNNLGGVLAAGAVGIKLPSGAISAGSSCTVTVNVTAATLGTYTNTSGTVSATTAGNGNTATANLTISSPHPAISVFKENASTNTASTLWNYYLAVPTGGNVYYQFQVQNDGDVPLSSVTVTDDHLSLAGCVWHDGDGNALTSPFTLQVANNSNNQDFAVCILGPYTAVAGTHTNIATADGTYSATHYTDTDWAEYATTDLTIAKSATQTYFTAAGNTLNYSYLVTNSGSAILEGPVTVTDNKATVTCPAVSTQGDGDNWFDPGEALTCTATYTVLAADVTAKLVTNTAHASISGIDSPNASLTIPLAPDLTAVKANNVSGIVAVGGSFNWTITVANSATAGSASFANTQVLLTDNLPTSGATFSVPATATNAGGTTGTISCAIATSTLTCTASGAVTIPPGGSFSIAVAVSNTVTGSLVNPKSGGICRADPNTVVGEINEANNDCADTVTVQMPPSITLLKTVAIYSDPVNLLVNPKFIPGAVAQYTIIASNSGGPADNNSTVITDPVPANTALYVNDIGGAGSGPVLFTQGATSSTLTYTFTALGNFLDDVDFSNDGGTTWTAVPVAGANGCDSTINRIRINPKGTFIGGTPNPSFHLTFRVCVQ